MLQAKSHTLPLHQVSIIGTVENFPFLNFRVERDIIWSVYLCYNEVFRDRLVPSFVLSTISFTHDTDLSLNSDLEPHFGCEMKFLALINCGASHQGSSSLICF